MSDIHSTMDLRTYTLYRVLNLVMSAPMPLTANETAALASWGGEPCLHLPTCVDVYEYMRNLAKFGLLTHSHGRFSITKIGEASLAKLQAALDSKASDESDETEEASHRAYAIA